MPFSATDLPTDIIEDVLDQIVNVPISRQFPTSERIAIGANLYRCALVSSRWKDPSLSRLYRHLEVKNLDRMSALASSDALPRYPTLSLRIACDGFYMDEDDDENLEVVVNGCEGLKSLEWESSMLGRSWLIGEILCLPALASIEHLTLKCQYGFTSHSDATLPIPFRLKSLTTDASFQSFRYLDPIKDAALSGPTHSLTSLTLTTGGWGLKDISLLNSIAPSLETLALPSFEFNLAKTKEQPAYFDDVLEFLRLATSLTKFTFETTSGSSKLEDVAFALREAFKAFTSSLHTIEFSGLLRLLSFDVILDAMRGPIPAPDKMPFLPLANLRVIYFSEALLEELEDCDDWRGGCKLGEEIEQRGIKVITMDGDPRLKMPVY